MYHSARLEATASVKNTAIRTLVTAGLCRRVHFRSRCSTLGRRARIGWSA
jgi:hypothetical protein